MSALRGKLIKRLEAIRDVEHRLSLVAGGFALFFMGGEFAHFYTDPRILRLATTRR